MVLNISRAARGAAIVLLSAIPAAAQVRSGLAVVGQSRPLLYGFALECVDCQPGEGARGRGGNNATGWTYASFPRVAALAPGSAAEKAGIKPGDLLLSIDGLSMITSAGAQRFASGVAGTTVRLVFERNSKAIEVPLALGAPLSAGSAPGEPTKVISGYMALQGRLPEGSIKFEIWSDEPIFSRDSAGTVVLQIGAKTVMKLQVTKDSTGDGGRGKNKSPN